MSIAALAFFRTSNEHCAGGNERASSAATTGGKEGPRPHSRFGAATKAARSDLIDEANMKSSKEMGPIKIKLTVLGMRAGLVSH